MKASGLADDRRTAARYFGDLYATGRDDGEFINTSGCGDPDVAAPGDGKFIGERCKISAAWGGAMDSLSTHLTAEKLMARGYLRAREKLTGVRRGVGKFVVAFVTSGGARCTHC